MIRKVLKWSAVGTCTRSMSTVLVLSGLAMPIVNSAAAQSAQPAQRSSVPDADREFEYAIRGDYFRGLMSGDREAWARARQTAEAKLAEQPDYPPALAWAGCMDLAEAGGQAGNVPPADRAALREQGRMRMDRAVRLAPLHPGTRIPRGVTLLYAAASESPGASKRSMLETAMDDLEIARALLAKVEPSEHARGELLTGLAEGYASLQNAEAARLWAEEVLQLLPGTRFAERAGRVLKTLEQGAGADLGAGAAEAPAEGTASPELARAMRALSMPEPLQEAWTAAAQGVGGDRTALDSAIARLEAMPEAKEPEMVAIIGGLRVWQSAHKFATGDFAGAMPLWQRGLGQLRAADAILSADEPAHAAAHLLRAGTLAEMARHDPSPEGRARMLAQVKTSAERLIGSKNLAQEVRTAAEAAARTADASK